MPPLRSVTTVAASSAIALVLCGAAGTVAPSAAAVAAPPTTAAASSSIQTTGTTETTATPAPPTLPERMRVLPRRCSQLVVCVGRRLGSARGTLFLFERSGNRWVRVMAVPARYGRRGLTDGATRVAGTRTTPTGIWRMGAFAFGHHASAPAGSPMPWRPITRLSYWSAVRDRTYNTWVRSQRHVSGERLSETGLPYEYAISSGYNAPPNRVIHGRGTAIFLHCTGPKGVLTSGCVAIDRSALTRLLTRLDPARGPCMAVGTERGGTNTSILAY